MDEGREGRELLGGQRHERRRRRRHLDRAVLLAINELGSARGLVPAQRPAAGVFERERETRRAGEAFRLCGAEAGRCVREGLRGLRG